MKRRRWFVVINYDRKKLARHFWLKSNAERWAKKMTTAAFNDFVDNPMMQPHLIGTLYEYSRHERAFVGVSWWGSHKYLDDVLAGMPMGV